MNYSAIEFLMLFPLYCAGYWALRRQRARLSWLLLGSILFYAYGDPAGLPVLAAVGIVGFAGGIAVDRSRSRAGVIVGIAVGLPLAGLAFFKYAGPLSAALPPSGFELVTASIVAPLGVSFFTFEAIAYVVDVRRGVAPAERSPFLYSLYVSLFPHLISGPIMRPNDLFPQLRRRITFDAARFASGLQLFTEGLIKKRLLADPAGAIVDRVFALPSGTDPTAAWLAALGYTVQIYGDFAGYTDMGRGIARMLGFELPLNFASPYAATSLRDFWRRWHISLSLWLRDYLYIPLGGNRYGWPAANLMITMLLGGLWHGAGVTFLLWGGYHGALLLLERRLSRLKLPTALSASITLFLVVNGWVLFRAHDIDTWLAMLRAMYLFEPGRVLPNRDAAFLLAAFVVVVGAMVISRIRPALTERLRAPGLWSGSAYAAGLAAVLYFAPTATVPFIYFRF